MVGVVVLEGDMLVHQITPSFVSLHEVVATDLELVTGTETVGSGTVIVSGTVTVITTRLVTVSVLRIEVEFHSPEDAGTDVLAGPVDKGIPVDDEIPVPENDDVGGGKSSKVLLGAGAEYGGGGA